VLPEEVWLLLLVNVDGAVVMYVAPVTVACCPATGSAGAVVAAAVDTGAAMAIALRMAATRMRRVRSGFMAIPFSLRGV
jgi:hypothetical protein